MIKFDYLEPESLDETFELLDQHGDSARVIAGGTSLIIWMRQRLLMPKVVISVARIPNFDTITINEHDGLCIGPGARHRDIELSPRDKQRYLSLHEPVQMVAQQINGNRDSNVVNQAGLHE